MGAYVSESAEGVVLRVHVQTRASRDEVVGPHGDDLKIRITAAPVEGAANKHLVRFLAIRLGVARSEVIIESGGRSRAKCVAIAGMTVAEVQDRLS
ncbi:MAG: DUF167 family protein [Syntrophobacteria bacterium]